MTTYYLSQSPLMLIQRIDNNFKILANFSDLKSRKINYTDDVESLVLITENETNCDFQVQLPIKTKICGAGTRCSDKNNVYRILGTGKFGVYSCIVMPDVFIFTPKKPLILNRITYKLFEWISEATNEFINTDKLSKHLVIAWNFILSLEQLEKKGTIELVDIVTKNMLKEFRNGWIELYYDNSLALHSKWPVYEKTKFQHKLAIPAPITAFLSSFEYDAIICDGVENNVSVILPHVEH
jgi:hypothetical protein